MQHPDDPDYNPNIDVMSSILGQLREKSDKGLLRQTIRENQGVFRTFYNEFDRLKQVGIEGASVEDLQHVMTQLHDLLTLFNVDHPTNFVMKFDPKSPYINELIDSGWHVSNLLWSASKQGTDAGFDQMYDRVVKEVSDRKLFELVRACYKHSED